MSRTVVRARHRLHVGPGRAARVRSLHRRELNRVRDHQVATNETLRKHNEVGMNEGEILADEGETQLAVRPCDVVR